MFNRVVDGIDVFEVGIVQLGGWIDSGSLDNPVYAAYPLNIGDCVIVLKSAVFGSSRSVPLVWTGYLNLSDAMGKLPPAVEFPNPDKPWMVGFATDVEIWHIVDDVDLWYSWERRVALSRSVRYYYAAHHYYGIDFSNDVFGIYRFPSRQMRDEFVSSEDWDGSSYKLEAVTRDRARHLFPQAFGDSAVVVETSGDDDYYLQCDYESQGLYPWLVSRDGSQYFGRLH